MGGCVIRASWSQDSPAVELMGQVGCRRIVGFDWKRKGSLENGKNMRKGLAAGIR